MVIAVVQNNHLYLIDQAPLVHFYGAVEERDKLLRSQNGLYEEDAIWTLKVIHLSNQMKQECHRMKVHLINCVPKAGLEFLYESLMLLELAKVKQIQA